MPKGDLKEALLASHVKIRDVAKFFETIEAFRRGGAPKLQIITDYDFTISKQHVNGESTYTSFALFSCCKGLNSEFIAKNAALKNKYYPIEINPCISREEKIYHMNKWYAECEENFNGLVVEPETIENVVKTALPELRDGTNDMLRKLRENEVPVLILSAGLGDVIKAVLTLHGIEESEFLHLVSNFFKRENSVICGYGNHENGKFIHPFNKSGLGCMEYFKRKNLEGRHNVILMGDSVGDANMSNGVPKVENVLKIGFLYGTPEYVQKSLPNFTQNFDIVLIDDQTMKIPMAILNHILSQE